jgi:EpsD family peptidyl-prolyl cis-trans isomerase
LPIGARIESEDTMKRNVTGLSALITIAATVGGCSGGNSGEKSQVVARVNDAEITVSQLRTALAAKGDVPPTAATAQQALDGLVNEQLLVDAALANKLDRDPVVVQAVEAARRQMLARAFLDRAVFPKQEIGAAEQASYYKAHPTLFAQRRVYQLASYTVASAQLTDGVLKELGLASSPDGVAAVLAGHHVAFETQNLTRAAEQLPLEQLPRFAAADAGDVVIQPAQDERTTLMLITGTQFAPLGFESAQPIIQQYLANVRNAEALDAHLKQARATASISHTDPALLVATAAPAVAAEPAEPAAQGSSLQHGAAVLN